MAEIKKDITSDFPALQQKIHGHRLAYLDSGASAQKPRQVLDAMTRFYETDYANIHRGVHDLSMRATQRYDEARRAVQMFINAAHEDEIVFTRGATESINLVAASWGRTFLKEGDEIVLTRLEHHANIVPWQMLRQEKGIVLRVVPIQPNGEVLLADVKAAIGPKTKLVSVAHVSNALGTILPVSEIVAFAHERGIPVLLDGCQAVSHMAVDVQKLGADFYVFSGHKLYGPTGIGVLYGKRDLLRAMPPYQGGGDMIASVTFEETLYQEPPMRFEAGTPAIAQAVGLHAAIEYVQALGLETIGAHEAKLLKEATERLSEIAGVRIVGTAPRKSAILSFVLKGVHPHDLGTILDRCGVAIRAGHHCAQPAMEALGLVATARASFGVYNTREDIDALIEGVKKAQEIFG